MNGPCTDRFVERVGLPNRVFFHNQIVGMIIYTKIWSQNTSHAHRRALDAPWQHRPEMARALPYGAASHLFC